jgi:prepilin-type N-terminal cleavage/methylation domain-containing protein
VCSPIPIASFRLSARPSGEGFTLIEMLMVMAIIGIVASLIFPVTHAIKKKQMITIAQSELKQVETAIESYKAKTGFYPPDNPGNPLINQLYFELKGTFLTNDIANAQEYFVTVDGSGRIAKNDIPTLYNNVNLVGFMNSSTNFQNTDEAATAVNFLKGLKPIQIGQMVVNGNITPPLPALLVCSVQWPVYVLPLVVNPLGARLNPWRYVSTHPTNNIHSYDLWVDILVGNTTNRISNWSSQPQLLQ